jgi:FMN-dependent NADH-azoreductase
MAKLLYVTAYPLDHSVSNSLSVGQEFLNEYRSWFVLTFSDFNYRK